MMLTEVERSFLDRRRRSIGTWPYVGSGMIAFFAAFVAWLMVTNPLLVNPFFVMSELKHGAIEMPTLMLMAGMLPMAILAAVFVCVAAVILASAAISNEKKYLDILDKFSGE